MIVFYFCDVVWYYDVYEGMGLIMDFVCID